MTAQEKLLNITEAASLLGLKRKTLYNLVHQRRIPYYKPLGKALRFKPSDLQTIVEESFTPAREDR
jgi:excisionase family DNA binding protein